jgi:type I restriction enzyme S subunit
LFRGCFSIDKGISEIVRGGSPRPIDKYMTLDKDALSWLKIADVDKNSKYVTFTKERVKKTALSKTREVHRFNNISI